MKPTAANTLVTLAALCGGLVAAVQAGPAPVDAAAAATPDAKTEIAKKLGMKPEEIRPSPVNGLYEVAQGADIAYVTTDGKYFLSGDLYDMQSRANLTDSRRSEVRVRMLDAVPESEMVVFGPAHAKYTLTVFTDVDCGYCRKLHSQIKEINKLGIRVRYLFYPRSGPGSDSWKEAEAVWCAPDRNDALTRAKLGEHIEARNCGPTPVAKQYELGKELGVRGTPGIFTEKGNYLPGYMPPAELLEQVKAYN